MKPGEPAATAMSQPSRKACPVVVRTTAGGVEILAFHHPTAGCQLVKGTVEAEESIHRAAERELLEESGIVGRATDDLGVVLMTEPAQEWHLVLCHVDCPAGQLPETWMHRTSDGGGLDFAFFWHPLDQEPDESWHPIFRRALAFIGERIKLRSTEK
jgi:ADP-ribose pyrophosphatase YjhB (NUDIX family)